MKKIMIFFSVLILLLAVNVGYLRAQNATNSAIPKREVIIPSDQTIEEDFYMTAGDSVNILGTVNGDLYVAGGQVSVSGRVNGDLLVAGGNVNISGEIGQDLRVAGGQVNVTGRVGKNITAMGGNIELSPTAVISGGVLAVGGNINSSAPIGGGITVAGGNLNIDNQVGADVLALTGSLQLGARARIGGDLIHDPQTQVTVSDQAVVTGTTRQYRPDFVNQAQQAKAREKLILGLTWLKLMSLVMSFVSALIIGLIMARLVPNFLVQTADTIARRMWWSLLLGLVILIVVPVVAVMLLISVIGIPLAVLIMVIYGLMLYLSKIYVAVWLGMMIIRRDKRTNSLYLPLFIGLVILYLIKLVPFLGGLIGLIAMLIGIGAAIQQKKEVYDQAYAKKLV